MYERIKIYNLYNDKQLNLVIFIIHLFENCVLLKRFIDCRMYHSVIIIMLNKNVFS